jgi:predicted RecA/RadA family phage recombinase
MAATSWNPKQPRIRATASGGVPEIRVFPEATTSSYKAGALVYLDASNGHVTILGEVGAVIAGIAQKDATGTTSADAPVMIFKPGDDIIMRCYDESDAAEVDADNFKAGFTYDTEIDSDGVAYAEIDTESATANEWVFVAPVLDSAGDSTTEGVFQLELHANQWAAKAE